jgi:hypothetical protein
MSHDSTKVLLGTTQSTFREGVTAYTAAVATYPAGTAVRLKNDGTISVTKADGRLIGVSLGQSLSDTACIAVLKAGARVPILLTDDSAEYAYVVKGASVYIDDVSGLANIVDDGNVTTTVSNAIYVSGALDGINEAGESVKVALIDMVGGL